MHGRAHRTTGLTLIEMTLVIATIALMVGFAVPAVRSLVKSFQSEGGVVSMVNAALSSARTMAVSRQRYVGIRFQKACVSTNSDEPLKGLMDAPQYMIFIVHEERKNSGDIADGFRAMEGLEPIKLPSMIGVMDLSGIQSAGTTDAQRDAAINDLSELSDATTFSVVFNPSGRLVVHNVRVRNKDGVNRSQDSLLPSGSASSDDIFNVADTICRLGRGAFIQDDYPVGDSVQPLGLGEEPSCTSFVVYELSSFRAEYTKATAWSACLSDLADRAYYVSPHTGDLIASD